MAHALVRAVVHSGYRAVEALIEGWRPPDAATALRVEEMAEVIPLSIAQLYAHCAAAQTWQIKMSASFNSLRVRKRQETIVIYGRVGPTRADLHCARGD